jgi:hypothetical protein
MIHPNDDHRIPEPLAGRVDLRKAILDGIEPPDELVEAILLAGRTHMLYGPSESGKTWILLRLMAQALQRGKTIVYFDSENGTRIVAERLVDLGVNPALLVNLHYYPFPSLPMDREAARRYAEFLDYVKPDLVAFDATVNFLGQCGLEENSNDDFVKWCTRYTRPARERDIAVVLLDHTPHEGGHARGASRKRDEVDVMWAVKCPVPFDRETTSTVTLRREKDREGWLPKSVAFNIGGTNDDGHIVCKRTDRPVIEVEGDDGLTPSQRTVVDALREEFGTKGARDSEWKGAAIKRGVSERTFYRAKSTAIARKLVLELDKLYFPADSPDGSNDGSREKRVNKRDSQVLPSLPNNCHDDNGSSENPTATTATTLKGGSSGSSADSCGETRAGIAGGNKRHSQVTPNSAQKTAREGKGRVVELRPDNLSLSPASDATAAQPAPETAQPENDALSNGGRLSAEEVEHFKELLRVGLPAHIARPQVIAARQANPGRAS